MSPRALPLDDDDLGHPPPRLRDSQPRGSALVALHGAHHVVNRRLAMQLRDQGLTPSEAVVLVTLSRYQMPTVSLVRQATGLRASTLDSLLDRLVEREVLQRVSPRDIPREVVIVEGARGRLLSDYAVTALGDVEEELEAFVGPRPLAALALVFEGARALGVPGTAADL